MMTNNRPVKDFRVGSIRATIWPRRGVRVDGTGYQSHNVVLERTYTDGRGQFQTTGSLDLNSIPKAILALKKAYEYLTITQGHEKEESAQTIMSGTRRSP